MSGDNNGGGASVACARAMNGIIGLYRAGRLEEAYGAGLRLTSLRPDDADLLQLIGGIAVQSGRMEDGAALLFRAAEIAPDNFDILLHLGGALHGAGRLKEAEAVLRRALTRCPDHGDALNNLGAVIEARGRPGEAAGLFRLATEAMPEFAKAHLNLGKALFATGNSGPAEAAFSRALDLDDGLIEALIGLGNAVKGQGRHEQAVAAYRRGIELEPLNASAHYNLGITLHVLGEQAAARAELEKVMEIEPSPGARVQLALLFPVIPASMDEIMEARAKATTELDAMIAEGVRINDPYTETRFTNFYLAYNGVNDRPLQQKIARFYLSACPGLDWTAPHCEKAGKKPGKAKGERIRLAIASAFFYDQTVGRLYRGIIENLDKNKFEIVIFRASSKRDDMADAIDGAADKVVALDTGNLNAARGQIAAEEADVLFYPDIGMTTLTFFLAFARLAPVQCVSWGHPVTTGIANLDYFISNRYLEPEGAEDHYSENLKRLEGFPMYSLAPDLPQNPPGRAHYGLPEGAALYLCPHTLFKFHPDFDRTLGALLERDADGRLVLITDGFGGAWENKLMKRFRAAFGDAAGRVIFLPRQVESDFYGLLALADAIIDVPHFTGGYTSQEAFAFGAPIVSWPGEFMRGRVTCAFYRKMGIEDLICGSEEEFLKTAYRLAHDRPWRRSLSARIREKSAVLFEDLSVVREMENFFVTALEEAEKEGRA
jgi:predicted O-linked N-acetylglucosamine transferase (SPINDLY family)